MSLISVLIPVTLLLVLAGVIAFFWAVRNGQFDDLDVPGWEILIDTPPVDRSDGIDTSGGGT